MLLLRSLLLFAAGHPPSRASSTLIIKPKRGSGSVECWMSHSLLGVQGDTNLPATAVFCPLSSIIHIGRSSETLASLYFHIFLIIAGASAADAHAVPQCTSYIPSKTPRTPSTLHPARSQLIYPLVSVLNFGFVHSADARAA